jgi:adenylate cyclase
LTPADLRKAIECFQQAISIEPTYAQAYALTAAAHAYLGATGQMLPDKAFEIVHLYADKALQLDNSVAEGHTAKASAYLFYEWKWKEAYASLQNAIHLNPGSIDTSEILAIYYVMMDQKEKAVEIMEAAEQKDPLSPNVSQTLGNMYVFAERYDDAIRQADKVLEMNPKMRICIELKGWATGMKGDWMAALELFKEVHRLTNHPLKGLMGVAFTYGKIGETEKAMECIRKMEQRQAAEPDSVIDADLAAAWYGMGDLDKTFYYLNQCVDKRLGPISYILEYPVYRELKNDPRYFELRKRVGI